MADSSDNELLAEFAQNGSEPAFEELVARYVNLVYSAALRFTQNSHHAEEVSQAVFIVLARKAGSLRPGVILSGWLYHTARLTAANFMKGEIRRQQREHKAYMESILNEPDAPAWERLSPLLENAMGFLGETDRNAVVLRYFENKSTAQVAGALNLNQPAAQRRLNRAIEKLRKILSKNGVALSAFALTGLLAENSVHAAPVALGKTISGVALAKGTAGASALGLANAVLKWMAWSQAKTAIITGSLALIAVTGTATGVVYRHELASEMVLMKGQLSIVLHRAGPVDLSDVYKPNSAFDLDARFYAWKTVPRGFQVFNHVPLQIDGVFYLWGEGSALDERHEVFPEKVLGIDISQKFEAIYIYQTAFFKAPNGTPVYSLVFNYADGSSVTNLMRYGNELLIWTPDRNKTHVRPTNPYSKIAWIGGSTQPDGKGSLIRLCLTEVRNPHPNLEVKTIDMYSCKSHASTAIFAMTTGKADLMR